MKFLAILFMVSALFGCQSMPDTVKDDGRVAADQAKQKAEAAYRDLEKEMK